ncbi:septal ring lytic transglycosylase RlpA family protein [Aquirufa sp. HETE-83D]|uniref:Probable endolytic peptidoglycan transglycosylase RlpA n=1 Tax=Aquirufa esocilacus TaxID=3096513 RepID=A0ABW6DGL0_9BACT
MIKILSIILLIFASLPLNTFSQDLGDEKVGIASYYATFFYGRKTSSGERLNKTDLTAAHRKFPFNTLVEVTNLGNRKAVIVRINDRGPYSKGRIIDLSHAAAKQIGLTKAGLARVNIKVVGFENELMLIPYQKLSLESTPKFSRNFYQKSRLKYKTHYKIKKNVKHKKYIKH